MKPRQNTPSKFKFSYLIIILAAILTLWVTFLSFYRNGEIESESFPVLSSLISSEQTNTIKNLFGQAPYVADPNKPEEIDLVTKIMTDNQRINDIATTTPLSGDDLLHLIFSTDCQFFQDWQSLLVFHSAIRVKQRGRVTRIASGCSPERQLELIQTYEKVFPDEFNKKFFVHFTPDFKKDAQTGKSYDFYNKPYGVFHWLRFASPQVQDGEIIVLLDPDMILLRPFTLQIPEHYRKNVHKRESQVPLYSGVRTMAYSPYVASTNLRSGETDAYGVPFKYQKGIPVSQLYGLGAPWTTTNKNFDKYKICGKDSPCTLPSMPFGDKFFSVGPPYIMEKSDFLRVTETWTKFVPR